MVSLGKALIAGLLALGISTAAMADCRRIVSLYVGHTENLAALGGGGRLVGVSSADDPDRFPGLPRLSPKAAPEEVLALRPDLVLMRPFNRQVNPTLAETLERLGVAVATIEVPSWEGFDGYLETLAHVAGGLNGRAALEKARALRSSLRTRAAKAREQNPAPRVFLEATSRELRTCAPDSWAARLIDLAGGRNAAASAKPLRRGSALAPWGAEKLLEAAASEKIDVYLIQQGPMNRRTFEELKSQPWFEALAPVRVLEIPEGWISRPSLESLEKGGELLFRSFFEVEQR